MPGPVPVTGWNLHEEDLRPGHQEYSVGPSAPDGIRPYFVGVPEPKIAKNRLHLDLIPPGDQQQELARLVALGASVADIQPDGVGWVILADPSLAVAGATGQAGRRLLGRRAPSQRFCTPDPGSRSG